jgi:hypothetical protein
MKKHVASLFFASALLLVLNTDCKKSSGSTTPPKTNTQLLVQASWKFKSASISGTDISSSLQACQKDNIMTFVAGGTGTIDEGPTKCNGSDPQTNPFTWNFINGETGIHASVILFTGATTNDLTIITLSETDLVVSFTYTNGIGPVQTIVASFTH